MCRVLFLITEKGIHHLCLERDIVTIFFVSLYLVVFFSIFFKPYTCVLEKAICSKTFQTFFFIVFEQIVVYISIYIYIKRNFEEYLR